MTLKTFRDAISRQDFVVTASLSLRPATTSAEIKRTIELLAPVLDAIQISDDYAAVGHMSPLAAASIVLHGGLDAVVQMSGRDRNRIALVGDVLGAAALGVTTLVFTRGEKLTDSAIVHSRGVFEINVAQLTQLASKIGSEASLVSDPGFLIGSLVTVFKPPEDWDAARISEKIDSGVSFLQTRPCLNATALRQYMQKLVERKFTHRVSVIVEVPLLTSMKDARTLKENDKSAAIPDSAVKQIADSHDPVVAGLESCAEMIAEVKEIPGVSGVNIRHDGEAKNIVSVIRQAGLKP